MKKFTIFLTILIFLIGGLVGGYFIGQNAETIKSWFEKDQTQQEQEKPGVDDPVIPEEPEKVEIKDFYFYGNTVAYYSGDEKEITIPASYSRVDSLSYTVHFDDSSDYENYQEQIDDIIKYQFQAIKIISDNTIIEPLFFEGGMYDLAYNWLEDSTNDIDTLFPATVEYYETTFYEGDDYIVENVGMLFCCKNSEYVEEENDFQVNLATYEKVILPSTIKQIDYCNAFDVETLKELVILNEDQVVTVGGPEDLEVPLACKIYVPDSLYEDYYQSNNYPTERLYKLSELGVVS